MKYTDVQNIVACTVLYIVSRYIPVMFLKFQFFVVSVSTYCFVQVEHFFNLHFRLQIVSYYFMCSVLVNSVYIVTTWLCC